MNIIACEEKCIHQKDGICTISGLAEPVQAERFKKNCAYFHPLTSQVENNPKDLAQRTTTN